MVIGIIVLGSTIITVQPIFGSSDQETAEEVNGPQDQSGEGGDGGSETSEPEPTEPEVKPLNNTSATDDEQLQEQEQLALDILTANGLTPLNANTNVDSNGNGYGVA